MDDSLPASDAEVADAPRRHPWGIAAAVSTVLIIVILDQLTKSYVEAVLRPGEFVPWLGERIGWQLVYNPGGAFGTPAPSWIFLVVTVIVIILVVRALPQTPLLTAALAYGLLLGGALGNVIDRLFRDGDGYLGGGYVVDFVAWGSFPRFNVADSSITVGFALLVVALLIDERQARLAEAADGIDPAPVDDAAGSDAATADSDDRAAADGRADVEGVADRPGVADHPDVADRPDHDAVDGDGPGDAGDRSTP